MFNKNYLLFLVSLCVNVGYSQTNSDLGVQLKNPLNKSTQQSMQSFRLKATVHNNGPDAFSANDSLALYVLIDGDSLNFVNASRLENFKTVGVGAFKVNDSFLLDMPFVFANSFDNQTIDFCLFFKPLNRASKSITDQNLFNNKACAQVKVVSTSSAINLLSNLKDATIWPNPVVTSFQMKCDFDYTHLYLMDALGRTTELPINPRHVYDCSALNSGIYTLIANNGIHTFQSQLVIQK